MVWKTLLAGSLVLGMWAVIAPPVETVVSAVPGDCNTSGIAVSVYDGDTFTLVDAYGQFRSAKIYGVDAPEKGQPWHAESAAKLKELVLWKPVRVSCGYVDRFGRSVGRVEADDLDVASALLLSGYVWPLANDASGAIEGFHALEDIARDGRTYKRGMWAKDEPEFPPDFRKRSKRGPFY